ncbi:MAG: ubiquinone anaerobic biosynthesis accessory factor UbiT [Acidiferrobacterales bacterium]
MNFPIQPILLALRLVPETVHSEIIARAASRLLRGQEIERRLPVLDGKRIDIKISDVPCTLRLRIGNAALHAVGYRDRDADVRIIGTLADYWKLASRAEDPDTLFFARRLCLEGDTETALHIKNLLDSLEFDWQAHIATVFGAHAGAGAAALFRNLAAIRTRHTRNPI